MFFLSSKLHATFFRLSFFLSIVCFSRIVESMLFWKRFDPRYFSFCVTFFLRFVFEERFRSIFEQNCGRFDQSQNISKQIHCDSILNIFARIQFVISKTFHQFYNRNINRYQVYQITTFSNSDSIIARLKS